MLFRSFQCRRSRVLEGVRESGEARREIARREMRRQDRLVSLRPTGDHRGDERDPHAPAEIARQEGHLPSLSMWRLANTWFHDGQFNRAAHVLDQLADEAARAGDLPVQALALYYSAWVNGKAGRGGDMSDRLKQVQTLLRSPYMPVGTRTHVGDLLNAPSSVARKP